jgi:hypothetical protein
VSDAIRLWIESDHYWDVSTMWARDAEINRRAGMPNAAKICLRHHIAFREKARALARQAKEKKP